MRVQSTIGRQPVAAAPTGRPATGVAASFPATPRPPGAAPSPGAGFAQAQAARPQAAVQQRPATTSTTTIHHRPGGAQVQAAPTFGTQTVTTPAASSTQGPTIFQRPTAAQGSAPALGTQTLAPQSLLTPQPSMTPVVTSTVQVRQAAQPLGGSATQVAQAPAAYSSTISRTQPTQFAPAQPRAAPTATYAQAPLSPMRADQHLRQSLSQSGSAAPVPGTWLPPTSSEPAPVRWAQQEVSPAYAASAETSTVRIRESTQTMMRVVVGSWIEAVWAGDGEYYDATIVANNMDGTVTVDWADGETRFCAVPLAHLRITEKVEAVPQVQIAVGDSVQAVWAGNGEYYNATIADVNVDGSVTVNWADGESSHRVVSAEQMRAAPQASAAEQQAGEKKVAAAFIVELDKTQGGKIGMDFVEYFAANLVVEGIEPGGLLDCWNLAHPGHGVRVGDHVTQVNDVVGNSAALIDELCCNTMLRMIVQRGDAAILPPQDAALAVQPEEKRNDVKVSRMTTKDGEDIVTVTDNVTGEEIGSFDKQAIRFELKCTDTQQLEEWLAELDDKLLPGLLMLLAGAVNGSTAKLKDLEKEQEELRGQEDYHYFGLDAETASDKDIERAYRKASMKLHPDKGGDPEEFDDMRKKFEALQSIREDGVAKTKKGDGTINWDPNSRESMMEAHSSLRDQLIWINHKCDNLKGEIINLKVRSQVRLAVDVKPHEDSAASSIAQPVPSTTPASVQPQ